MNTLSFQPPSVSRLHPCGGPDTYCIFSGFFLSLLAKIFPRIMKKSMYSSCIQSGGFWNKLATGEFLSNFFFSPDLGQATGGTEDPELSREPAQPCLWLWVPSLRRAAVTPGSRELAPGAAFPSP